LSIAITPFIGQPQIWLSSSNQAKL
jgi:hypothetical protein